MGGVVEHVFYPVSDGISARLETSSPALREDSWSDAGTWATVAGRVWRAYESNRVAGD